MREQGLVTTPAGLGLSGHACWTYHDDADLRRAALAFLRDGAELGQRLMAIGISGLGAAGDVIELAPATIQGRGGRTDPSARLAFYSEALDQALEDGYAGLRVAAEMTDLVRDPADWDAHTRWEAIADRYMINHPLAALCCCDRRVLGARICHDLDAMHPVARSGREETPFRLFAREDAMALAGDVDYFAADALRRTLALAADGGAPPVLDCSEVGFIDHHGVLAIAEHASSRAPALVVRDMPAPMRRACALVGVEL